MGAALGKWAEPGKVGGSRRGKVIALAVTEVASGTWSKVPQSSLVPIQQSISTGFPSCCLALTSVWVLRKRV